MCSTDARRSKRRAGADLFPALSLLVLATAGCASTGAPRDFLPDATEAQTDAFGSWLDVVIAGDAGPEVVEGELIAIDDEVTWVLTASGIRSFASSAMVEGQLAAYDPRSGTVAGNAALGVVSTISNGVLLVFTAPMWIIGGTAAAASQSRAPLHDVREVTPASLAPFARFPRGMPPGLDPGSLVGRPEERP